MYGKALYTLDEVRLKARCGGMVFSGLLCPPLTYPHRSHQPFPLLLTPALSGTLPRPARPRLTAPSFRKQSVQHLLSSVRNCFDLDKLKSCGFSTVCPCHCRLLFRWRRGSARHLPSEHRTSQRPRMLSCPAVIRAQHLFQALEAHFLLISNSW